MKHIIIGALAALALAGTAQAQQKLVLGHTNSTTSHYGLGATAFFEKLEELSGGTFTGEQAPAGQLGGERDLIEGLQIGSVDLVITSTGPLGNFVPEALVLDLPFLFRDSEHARKTLDGEIGQELLAKIGEHDLVALAWAENGFRNVTNNKHPVKSPDDLKGLKVRTMENKVHMAAFEGMGAAPTPMAFPELFGALQQGVIDGQENPLAVIVSSKFWEVQKHASLTRHVYSPAIILASPSLINGLTDEQKGWFYEAAKAAVEANRAAVDRFDAEGVELLRSHGVEVITEVDATPFREMAEKAAYGVYTDQYGTELVERIKAVE